MSSNPLKILADDVQPQADACGHSAVNIVNPGAAASVMAEPGFAGNVLMVTLGCAKNLVDSEVMLGAMRARGFRPIDEPEHADVIVVNTCAFLQSAVEEGIDRILEMSRYKETGRCRRLIVAGCMVERYRKDLESSLPEVDRFVSTDELLSVAEEGATGDSTFEEARRPYFLYDEGMPRLRSTLSHTAYIKVSEGCDRPCSFCIIPKIRGSFRSRSVESVIQEGRMLIQDGVREINLVAQDLTAYGSDLTGKKNSDELLRLLSGFDLLHRETNSEFWVRLLYAYPIGVNEALIRAILESPVVCNYLDLPLQHISGPVLKRMNRPLGERGTRGLIEQIRTIAPELALRTTFIVGFPGETEEDIQSLEQFVSEGHFTHAGVFTYSQEQEAKSFHFPDQIEEEEKQDRRRRIMEAQQRVVSERFERSMIGRTIRVLVDDLHPETDLLLSGRTPWQAPETDGEIIINELPESLLREDGEGYDFSRVQGRFTDVEITESAGYDLVGKLIAF